jgi:hypothetical protein
MKVAVTPLAHPRMRVKQIIEKTDASEKNLRSETGKKFGSQGCSPRFHKWVPIQILECARRGNGFSELTAF